MMQCFKSSDKAAENISRVYNDNDDNGHYWDRGAHPGPLHNCSSSRFNPPNTTCLVCRDQDVFAVCKDLPAKVAMKMEHFTGNLDISQSACPPLAAEDPSSPLSSPTGTIIGIIIPIIILLLLCIVGFLCYKRWKRPTNSQVSSNGLKRKENGTDDENESHELNEVTSSSDQRDEDEAASASRPLIESESRRSDVIHPDQSDPSSCPAGFPAPAHLTEVNVSSCKG